MLSEIYPHYFKKLDDEIPKGIRDAMKNLNISSNSRVITMSQNPILQSAARNVIPNNINKQFFGGIYSAPIYADNSSFKMFKKHQVFLGIETLHAIEKIRGQRIAVAYSKLYDFNELFHIQEEEQERKEQKSSIIINELASIQTIIKETYADNSTLLKLHHYEFEQLIKELLSKQGYQVQLSPRTRDGGFDILAIQKDYIFGELKFLVECKHYKSQKVGVGVVRSFRDVLLQENAHKGLIVTADYFTKDAHKSRNKTPWLLDLKDRQNIIDWVNEYYLSNILRISNHNVIAENGLLGTPSIIIDK